MNKLIYEGREYAFRSPSELTMREAAQWEDALASMGRPLLWAESLAAVDTPDGGAARQWVGMAGIWATLLRGGVQVDRHLIRFADMLDMPSDATTILVDEPDEPDEPGKDDAAPDAAA